MVGIKLTIFLKVEDKMCQTKNLGMKFVKNKKEKKRFWTDSVKSLQYKVNLNSSYIIILLFFNIIIFK